jgi:hypothetical protein
MRKRNAFYSKRVLQYQLKACKHLHFDSVRGQTFVELNLRRFSGLRRETPGSCNTFVIVGVLAAEPAGVQRLDIFQGQILK